MRRDRELTPMDIGDDSQLLDHRLFYPEPHVVRREPATGHRLAREVNGKDRERSQLSQAHLPQILQACFHALKRINLACILFHQEKFTG